MSQPFCQHSRLHLESLEDRLVPSTVAGSYADGVWRYDTGPAGWSHISNLQATQLDVDDAGDVYGTFSDGLWRWQAATASWAHLSNLSVQQFQVTAAGVLYGDFGSQGVWRWSDAGWMTLSDLKPTQMAVSDSDTFFGCFTTGSAGTWRWSPSAGWSLLSSSVAAVAETDTAGNFVGLYTAAGQLGTWRWNPTAGWTRLSRTGGMAIAVSANGTIYENRGFSGIWRAAAGATSFTQIEFVDTNTVVMTALPDGGLYEDSRYLPFPGWYWNGGIGRVKIIADSSELDTPVIGKDGDLFYRDLNPSGGGTEYWSLQVAYHLVAGNTQRPNILVSQR
jgi:hypothetical protein